MNNFKLWWDLLQRPPHNDFNEFVYDLIAIDEFWMGLCPNDDNSYTRTPWYRKPDRRPRRKPLDSL